MSKKLMKKSKIKVTTNFETFTPEQKEKFLERLGDALYILAESVMDRKYGKQ